MSTIEPPHLSDRKDELEKQVTLTAGHTITFPEWFVMLNGCIPLLMLAYDARLHRLGPDPIRTALHTSGTLAIVALIATLSISPLRSLLGANTIFFYRRPLGLLTFLYAFMHAGIYVAHDQAGQIEVAWDEITRRRYLQVGAIALALMVPLVITSTPRTVQWLGFRKWKHLHRLIYLSAILGVLHQFLQTRADTSRSIALTIALVVLFGHRIYVAYRKRSRPKGTQRHAVAEKTLSSDSSSKNPLSERMFQGYQVRLTNPQQTINVGGDQTILEAAESAGISLPHECRIGVCGTCQVRLISGQVTMEVDDGLQSDPNESTVLACQAICQSDVTIDTGDLR